MSQQTSQQQHQHHNNNGWTTRGEKLVRYWQEECRLYAWMYEQNATFYARLNRTLGIASIALSAITGTTLFNQSASDTDTTSSNILIGLGVSSIASTILSGLKELLDLNSLITQNTNAARENSSIVMDIDEQMNIDRADRIDGREFMKSIKDRKNNLIQNGPIIPSRQWKQVHRKIQSKEQLGFLNREVFNEYLEQSVDINKLQFGSPVNNMSAGINQISSGGLDYGTPSSNSTGIDSCLAQSGQVVIDMPSEQQTIHKRATLTEKLAFYGGPRYQVLPIIPLIPSHKDLEALDKEIENLQPRCVARKAILENQYELERLLSKSGELKNKDRQQIANLRDKARGYRENYNKLINPQFADYNIIINNDCSRVEKIIKAYRDGHLSEPEVFRIIQLDLMEIDRETFQEETRVIDLINKTRRKIEQQQNEKDAEAEKKLLDETQTRYPFRENNNIQQNESTNNELIVELSNLYQHQELVGNQLKDVFSEIEKIKDKQIVCHENEKDELIARLAEISQIQESLLADYEMITARITDIETTQNISKARIKSVNMYNTTSVLDMMPSSKQMCVSRRAITPPPIRPSSTAPSDDEFIENMISDNLCSKQLRDVIKPIAIPSSSPQSPGQDTGSSSNSNRTPKRRSSKYDAQMRYQTGRIS